MKQRETELRNQLIKRSKDPNDDNGSMSSTHSDDSGFSTSPSPVNGTSADETLTSPIIVEQTTVIPTVVVKQKKEFIPTRTSGFNVPRQMNPLVRTMSTPQIFTPSTGRRFNAAPVQKGLMQKFIAARGRLSTTKNTQSNQLGVGGGSGGGNNVNQQHHHNHQKNSVRQENKDACIEECSDY